MPSSSRGAVDANLRRALVAALEAVERAGPLIRAAFLETGNGFTTKDDGTPVTPTDLRVEEVVRDHLRVATPEYGVLGEEFGAEGDTRARWILDPLDGTRNFVAGIPIVATLLGLELDGEDVLGVVHAPLLGDATRGRTWWAVRDEGAWSMDGVQRSAGRPRRLAARHTTRVAEAFVLHGGLLRIRRAGLWDALARLTDDCARTRGFGDFQGHLLVAEGRADVMLDASIALHDVAALRPILEEAGARWSVPGGETLDASSRATFVSSTSGLADELARRLRIG